MLLPVNYAKTHHTKRRLVREEYVRLQAGKCYHCGALLSGQPTEEILSKPLFMRAFPPNFLAHPVHLHHSHDTGLTLGAVHSYCNGVLWQYHGE